MRRAVKTFYEQLSLSHYASFDEIRGVIIRTRLDLERTPADGRRKALLDRLQAAERVLLDPDLRAKYDQEISSRLKDSSVPISLPRPSTFPLAPTATVPAAQVNNPVRNNTPATPAGPAVRASCETCGTHLEPGARHCPVCGTEFDDPPPPSRTSTPESRPASNSFGSSQTETAEQLEKFFRLIGWSYARGTIVSADQPYHVEAEFILSRLLIKVGIFALVAWIGYNWLLSEMSLVVILIIGLILLAVFVKGVFMVVLMPFKFIFSKLLGSGKAKDKQVHVRDVRLRDEALREYIVRFRGELRSGHVMAGDQIEIWGRNRGGTIMARWGYNFRTKSRIWVKYR
jgi:hypothetical protein